MKKILQTLLIVLMTISAQAQVPQGIPYQAAARNANGNIMANQAISVRFTIHDSTANGAAVYQETHSTTTNAQGMFTLNMGMGNATAGTFAGINWGSNAKFMQVELSTNGGNNYTDMGTQQMMSVPYALYAKEAQNGFKHYIGEIYGGGVVFHVYRDAQGNEHGLIVALNDQSLGTYWSNVSSLIGINAQSTWDGLSNSISVVNQSGHVNSASKLCLDLITNGESDWYLPSIQELKLIWDNLYLINRTMSNMYNATVIDKNSSNFQNTNKYWSSTENEVYSNSTTAYLFDMENGVVDWQFKQQGLGHVRAVRSF